MFPIKPKTFGLEINDFFARAANLSCIKTVELGIGIVKDGEIKDQEKLCLAIKKLLAKAKIKEKYVVASLPEKKSFFQVIQMPKMKDSEIESAVLFEAENHIPLPIDQVYLDFQLVPPIKDSLDHLDILIAACPKAIVDSYVDTLKKSGLIPFVMEIESQALARSMIKKGRADSPVILLDLRKNEASFVIFSGYSIRLTESVPFYDLQDLYLSIKKYIDFYKTHVSHEHLMPGKEEIEKIIICGDCDKNMAESLQKKIRIPVQVQDASAAAGLELRGIISQDYD